jgi:hypothetical protein
MGADTENKQVREYGCVPTELHLQTRWLARFSLDLGQDLMTSGLYITVPLVSEGSGFESFNRKVLAKCPTPKQIQEFFILPWWPFFK